jgi:type I restriction-modification system DNA methylase subunit
LVASFDNQIAALNKALANLENESSVEAGLEVCVTVLALLGEQELPNPAQIVDSGLLKLPNSERQDPWFHQHPWMRGERAAFEILDAKSMPLQAKFYWLQKKGNAFVAGGVHFTKNWEDHDFTRTDEFKVGIDFFLTPDASAVLIVLSNRGKLRVLELSHRLTNTQLEIFQRWAAFSGVTQREVLHNGLWESFKLQSVNTRFYDGVSDAFNELLAHLKESGRQEEESKLFASRLMGRLIFIWFLRKMGLISHEIEYFDAEQDDQGAYYRTRLERLFFRTLNQPIGERDDEGSGTLDLMTPYLNGGLFSPRADDWSGDTTLTFPVAFFPRIFEHFNNFNFTTDESTPEYEQVAIDPEMLGRVFESLLASQVESTGEQARKAKGAFYTPREIVSYMCKEAIRSYLEGLKVDDSRLNTAVSKLLDTSDQDWAIAGTNSLRDIPAEFKALFLSALNELKSVDPACGSGAFPLGMLQLLSKLQLRLDPRLDHYKLKLSILQNNIFGVDIEPMAVEISRLRSWLSLIVEEKDRKTVEPLPNLDFNFVCANSLISLESVHLLSDPSLQESLRKLRLEYFTANTQKTKVKIQEKYFKLSSPDLFDEYDERAKQLKTFNPFDSHQVADFFDPEEMFGVDGGFDVVVGNPPYIGEKGHTNVFEPVKHSPLGKRFYQGKMDYFYFFFHLGLDLLKPGGTVSFITTNYFITATFARKLIDDMAARSTVIRMLNFNELKLFESAAGQHNMITVLAKGSLPLQAKTTVVLPKITGKATTELIEAVFAGNPEVAMTFELSQAALIENGQIRLSNSSENPIDQILNHIQSNSIGIENHFRVLSGIESSVDTISQAHINKFGLDQGELGSGVFVLTKGEVDSLHLDDHEAEIIKPWFKNSDVSRYYVNKEPETFVIFADKRTNSLESRPKLLEHLNGYRALIDKASSNSPYLARPRSTDYDAPKIVVPYKTPTTRFAIAYGPWYASRDIYYIVSKSGQISLETAVGILNSKLMLCWLAHRGKRKGGLLELYQEPLAAIPLPRWILEDSELLMKIQALVLKAQNVREQHRSGDVSSIEREIDEAVFTLYRLEPEAVKLIQDWDFVEEQV